MGKPLRVLIVEDSEDDALLLLRELKRGGYDVEFERVETATAMLSALANKTWDLILSDYTLPEFNAPQALEVLKASDLDLPFIISSGTIGEDTAVAALKAGANDFLVKGEFARLGPAIERELREAESRRERRRAEDQLKYQARLLRHINDAVIATDDQLRITAWNRAAEKMYGWSGEEVIGRIVSEILSDELTDEQRAEAGELLQPSIASRSERIYRRKNGRTIYVEANTIALTDAQGKMTGYLSVDRDITERKRAEQEIESLAKFPYEDISPVLRFARDGRLLYANPASAGLLRIWNCEVGDRPPEEIQLIVYQSLIIAPSQEIEVASGDTIHALRFVPIVDKDYVNVYGRDITERKRSEEALADSESRYRMLFKSNPHPMWVYDLETLRFLAVNDAAVKHYGFSQDEFLLLTIKDLRPPEDVPALMTNLMEAQQEFQASGPWKHRKKDGTLIDVEITSHSVQWKERPARLVLANDITERKRSEEKIERQLQRLNALRAIDMAISSSFDVHVTLDIVLRHVLSQLGVDAAAVLLFDPGSQMIEYVAGHGFQADLPYHAQRKLGEAYAARAILKRKTIHISDLMEGKQVAPLPLKGATFVDYYGVPLMVKGEIKGVLEIYHRSRLEAGSEWLEFLETLGGQAAIAIDNAQLFENLQRANSDLERRVAQRTEELNQTNIELGHANRAKDEFLASMSHELRTPLNAILGLSEMLLEERHSPLTEPQRRALQVVSSSGQHLLSLINDILEVSKIEAGKLDVYPDLISVKELCVSSLNFVQELALNKSIVLDFWNRDAIATVYADLRRLKQILVNLLSNAVKFTPEKGNVSLEVEVNAERDQIQFIITDTGIGIAPEDMQKLFTPFTQLDSSLTRQHSGTGLGLVLVYKFTELHGGSIHVESELGKGSCFTIALPWSETPSSTDQDETASTPMEIEQASTLPAQEPGLVLLVEDNATNIMVVSDYLQDHGFSVALAHNGFEALDQAEKLSPSLILMDIQMPEMDGLEAIRRLRADPRFASTPIIALTALAMPGDRERCLEAGANEYMSKPVSLKVLVKTIDKLLKNTG